ncbi:MAG: T9SS type A sorting domain-containing protein [Ignavibacteriales bacterium]|nr:T9SS type A sorting domain-containing protein [Ignavibacteriales bacterium]
MKNIICALVFLLFTSSSFSQSHSRHRDIKQIDINQIKSSLSNLGTLGFDPNITTWDQLRFRDYLTGSDLNGTSIVYAQGLWMLGKINGEKHASVTEWNTHFSPGPIINGQPAMLYNPLDSARYTVYKINKGDDQNNPDYNNWPIDLGAPVDNNGNPLIKGDQTLWTDFNAADSTTLNYWQWFQPNNYLHLLPIEIQQLAFARAGNKKDNEDIFSNTIFFEYLIINKGNSNIDSAFFGFWNDIDFYIAHLNPPAIDTVAQVGYCWALSDTFYNLPPQRAPAAVGFTLVYGPSVPSAGQNSVFNGRSLPDHKNLPLTAFHGINDDQSNYLPFNMASSINDAWNMANGLQSDGLPNVDPSNGQVTKFQLSGDPITNQGWIYPENSTGGGAGFVMFTGPFNLAVNDTQWIMIALTPALGNNRFESIKIMREKAMLLRSLHYDTLAYGTTPYKIDYVDTTNLPDIVESEIVPDKLVLYQNFPNPFNPETTIIFGIPQQEHISIKIFDILGREVRTLLDEVKDVGTYRIRFNSFGLASGIYIYRISSNNSSVSRKMIILR